MRTVIVGVAFFFGLAATASGQNSSSSSAPGVASTTGTLVKPSVTKSYVNGASVMQATPPLTPEQKKANEAFSEAWQARCHPNIVEDQEGIRRAHYDQTDCDLSPFNNAGVK